MNLTRSDFLKKAARYLLASLLALIALILGSRTTSGNDCASCPGKGICNGDSDCGKFIQDSK